jgi:ribonucleoside-triphosphate reductase (formate)
MLSYFIIKKGLIKMTNQNIKVKRRKHIKTDATQIQMMIASDSEETYEIFDKQFIINSLIKEADIDESKSILIANDVEQFLLKNELLSVSTSFIRNIINYFLSKIEHEKHLKYSSLSIPIYDIQQLIENHNKENSNTNFSPESINLTVAGQIIKQYSFRECIDSVVVDAHLKGDIYIHDSDFWALRPYCSGNSLLYILKHGLRFPNMVHSGPAKHALTLVNHLQCFASYLQGLFSGAIGVDAVNVFFAPLLEGMEYKEIKQVAQHLIFSFAQLAANRGAQVVFSDFNLFFHIPEHYKNTPAIGKGGKLTGKTYKEYEHEARLFLKALFEVALEGDENGANFPFPKLDVHINEKCFENEDEIFDLMCELNSKRGSAYIVYDRGTDVKISECCRLAITLNDDELKNIREHPEDLRFSAWQICSINLPRIAYKFKDIKDIHNEIDRLMKLVMTAHKNKYDQLVKLMNIGANGPMGFLAKGFDGKPYLKVEDAKFLVGMIGLNEMMQCLTGLELHESENTLKYALEIMAYFYLSMEKTAKEFGLRCMIEQTPAESLSLRSALTDIKQFPEALQYVKGDIKTGNIYYTNSTHLAYNSNVDILTRIEKQSKFDPLIKAGSITHLWHGENEPDPQALKQLYKTVLLNTNTVQTADSPDMTVCPDCNKTSKGLLEKCPICNSTNIYQTTRVTGYFSQISGWSKGKLAELKDRTRVSFKMDSFKNIDDDIEKILFFSKPNCPKCDDLKRILKEKNIELEHVSTEDYKGLALGCYYNISELPCLIKVKGSQVISKISGAGSYLKWLKDNK